MTITVPAAGQEPCLVFATCDYCVTEDRGCVNITKKYDTNATAVQEFTNYGSFLEYRCSLGKQFKQNPEINYVVIFVVAGHGMNERGQQIMLINEFNPKTNWYKMFNLEQFIRTFAESYQNTYTMTFPPTSMQRNTFSNIYVDAVISG